MEWFHHHVRIERMLFEGAPSANGGAMHPDLSAAGHGMTLSPGAEEYRVG